MRAESTASGLQSPAVLEITPTELKAKLGHADRNVHLVDVREPEELALCGLDGAQHIPMLQLFAGLQTPRAEPETEIVVFCHHGERSLEAAKYLRLNGFDNARSLAGGLEAWAAQVDPTMPRY
jgi:rhodanese-related sulfurtransferase